MERKPKLPEAPYRVDAILTSDWHLRDDTPICRTDDLFETLRVKVKFVKDLQERFQCPVLHAGDLFHYWKGAQSGAMVARMISFAIKELPEKFWTVFGQHEMPLHSMDLIYKSALSTLFAAERVSQFEGWANWGEEPKEPCVFDNQRKVMVMHRMVWQGERPWPGCKDLSAKELLEAYPEYDLILTGDNHKPFTEKMGKRLLVNPGSLSRQTADQMDHKPRVYLWSSALNEVHPVFLPISPSAVTRDHLENKAESDERIKAFVEWLANDNFCSDMSFEANIERFGEEHGVPESIMMIIRKAAEKEA